MDFWELDRYMMAMVFSIGIVFLPLGRNIIPDMKYVYR